MARKSYQSTMDGGVLFLNRVWSGCRGFVANANRKIKCPCESVSRVYVKMQNWHWQNQNQNQNRKDYTDIPNQIQNQIPNSKAIRIGEVKIKRPTRSRSVVDLGIDFDVGYGYSSSECSDEFAPTAQIQRQQQQPTPTAWLKANKFLQQDQESFRENVPPPQPPPRPPHRHRQQGNSSWSEIESLTSTSETFRNRGRGLLSAFTLRAETAVIRMVLGKQSLRAITRMVVGKAGVELVDKSYQLIESLIDDSKKTNKFINTILKVVSEFGVLVARGVVPIEQVLNLQEELETICQNFVELSKNANDDSGEEDELICRAKEILNESVATLEEMVIGMLPSQAETSKSVKRIRQISKVIRQPQIIEKLYDPESEAFRLGEEFGMKCEQVNRIVETLLSERQHFINQPTDPINSNSSR